MLLHKTWTIVGITIIIIITIVACSSNSSTDGNSTEKDISHLTNEGDSFDEGQQNGRESYHVLNGENGDDNSLEINGNNFDDDSQFNLNGLRNNLIYISNASWTDISKLDVDSVQNCTTCPCLCLWLAEMLVKYDSLRTKVSIALYEKNINITSENEMMLVRAEREFHSFKIRISNQIESSEFRPNSLVVNCGSRVRNFIGILKIKEYLKPSDPKEAATFQTILASMKSKHSTSVVRIGNKTLHLTPDLTKIMTRSRNYFELLWAWKGWHDSSGSKIKENFTDLVKLQNKAAKQKGYSNAKDIWKYMGIGGVDSSQAMAGLMDDIKPLYEQLHAFVRARLVQYYSHQLNGTSHQNVLKADGPIPAHILGDMYAQDWSAIEDIVLPFPNQSLPNITGALLEQKYTVRKMFQLAEDFFISLGFQPMTNVFWNKSVIERPLQDVHMSCHPTSYDIGAKDDFRIKMCGQVDAKNLEIIHHEMGHIVDFMEQRHLPILLRQSIFKEATGDTIALSVMSQTHLRSIGLINSNTDEGNTKSANLQDLNVTEIDINFLMRQALTKVSFLPFAFSLELWRYEVLENKFNSSEYNDHWWQIRRRYQGITPPINRSSDKFDPGAKYHIAANYAYSGYFLSYIAQFQFHEALCKEANHSGPLHTCDIYASERAGRKLRSVLSKGSSANWEELMRMMTGQARFSSRALLQYFDPLYRWLLKANECSTKGW